MAGLQELPLCKLICSLLSANADICVTSEFAVVAFAVTKHRMKKSIFGYVSLVFPFIWSFWSFACCQLQIKFDALFVILLCFWSWNILLYPPYQSIRVCFSCFAFICIFLCLWWIFLVFIACLRVRGTSCCVKCWCFSQCYFLCGFHIIISLLWSFETKGDEDQGHCRMDHC